jgi:hypothetical protein
MNAQIINFKKKVMVKGRYILLLMIIPFTFSCLDTDFENSQNTPTAYVSFSMEQMQKPISK